MSVLQSWLDANLMNPDFQKMELCRIFNLQIASANGIITFTGGDDSPLAREVVGKTYNYNLEEVMADKQKVYVVPEPYPTLSKAFEAMKADKLVGNKDDTQVAEKLSSTKDENDE